MTILLKRRVLAAKIETTSGVAETLTSAADCSFNAYDVVIQQDIESEEREASQSFGTLSAVPGGYKGRATFRIDCGWDGTSTEPSWADTFLPACGWVKTGQVFTPRSEGPGANVKTLTIGCYLGPSGANNGPFKSLSGCAGTFTLVCPTGKMAYFEFDFQGVWITPSDVAVPSSIVYPTALPLRYANSTSTWAGTPLCVESITLDAGNEVVMRECAAANGFEAAIITDRRIRVTANPEMRRAAVENTWTQFTAMTEGVLTWGLDGPTNSVLTIAAPKAQLVSVTEGNRNKIVTNELEWACNKDGSTPDTDASFTFTAAT
jgi:hypothetical protein